MPVFKNEDNGTWYVMARYVNWKGECKQKCKRGFATKKEAQEWAMLLMKMLTFHSLILQNIKIQTMLLSW